VRAQQTFERLFAAGLDAGAIGDEIGAARGADRVALLAGWLLRRDRMDPKSDGNNGDQRQKGKRRTMHRASSLEISSSQMVEACTTGIAAGVIVRPNSRHARKRMSRQRGEVRDAFRPRRKASALVARIAAPVRVQRQIHEKRLVGALRAGLAGANVTIDSD
jgi:hypothetical protein